MAKIVEETITLTFSRIVRNESEGSTTTLTDEIRSTIESVAQELVGSEVVVEAACSEDK